MEAVVEQCSDIVNIVTSCAVNESVNMNNYVNEKCSKCLELEIELIKKSDMIERDVFDKLSEHLNAQLQEKVFAVAALKNELRKLKEKNVVDTAVSTPIATTIAPGKFKLDIEPISHRLKNNRDP
ncbi:hypothetical protein Tco_0900609 [Tanacetum coccineum]